MHTSSRHPQPLHASPFKALSTLCLLLFLVLLHSPASAQNRQPPTARPQASYDKALRDQLKDCRSKRMAGKYAEALKVTDAIIKKHPNCYEALIERGWVQALSKKYRDAFISYDSALKLQPQNYLGFAHRGWCWQLQRNHKLAIENFNRAIQLNSDDLKSRLNRAYSLDAVGRTQEALKAFELPLKKNPDDLLALRFQALLRSDLGDLEGAISDYTQIIRLHKTAAFAFHNRAQLFWQRGLQGRAEQDFLKAAKLAPRSVPYHRAVGLLYVQTRRFAKAEEFLSKTLSLRPSDKESRLNRAVVYQKLGRYFDSINDCNKVVSVDKKNFLAYAIRAEINLDRGDAETAQEDLIQVRNLRPKDFKGHLQYIETLSMQKQHKRVIEEVKQALLLKSNSAYLFELRARAHLALNEPLKASEDYFRASGLRRSIQRQTRLVNLSRMLALKNKKEKKLLERAFIRMSMNDHLGAIKDYESALIKYPDDLVAHTNHGFCLVEVGRVQDAIEAYNRALKIEPKYTQARRNRCFAKMLLAQFDEAIKDAEAILAQQPSLTPVRRRLKAAKYFQETLKQLAGKEGNVYAQAASAVRSGKASANDLYRLGKFFLDHGAADLAEKSLSRCLRLQSKNVDALRERAIAYYQLKQAPESYNDARRACTLSNNASANLFARAMAQVSLGDVYGALADFNACIKADPKNIKAYHNRALVHEKLKNSAQALADLGQAIALDPSYLKAYHSKGRVLLTMKRVEEGLQSYSQAIKVDSKNPQAYAARAQAYMILKYWDEALKDWQQVATLDPQQLTPFMQRAYIFSEREEWSKALTEIKAACKIDPGSSSAFTQKGQCLGHLGKHKEAIAAFTVAISNDRNNADAYFARGVAQFRLKQYQQAVEDFTKTFAANDQHMASILARSGALAKMGLFKKSEEDASRYLSLYPKNPSALVNRGYARLEQGKLDDAIADLSQALSAMPTFSGAYRHRGRALLKKGQLDKALADLKTAYSLGKTSGANQREYARALARKALTEKDPVAKKKLEAQALNLLKQAQANEALTDKELSEDKGFQALKDRLKAPAPKSGK